MIDTEIPASLNSFGDTGSTGYTTVAWVGGAGEGFTVTPTKGDTGKTLFLLNAGTRDAGGGAYNYGTYGRCFSGTQSSATNAWYLVFSEIYAPGVIASGLPTKLYAFSLRCVRS